MKRLLRYVQYCNGGIGRNKQDQITTKRVRRIIMLQILTITILFIILLLTIGVGSGE